MQEGYQPPTPSFEEEGEKKTIAPSSLQEGLGGGGVSPETLRQRATAMRSNPTPPEKRLWSALKGKQLDGFKFRRQQVIGARIVDFFCADRGLVIEIDGDTHDAQADALHDERMVRDFGFATLRLTNGEVMDNLDGCLVRLKLVLETTPERWACVVPHHPPTPSSEEEGGKAAKAPSSLEEGVGGGGGT